MNDTINSCKQYVVQWHVKCPHYKLLLKKKTSVLNKNKKSNTSRFISSYTSNLSSSISTGEKSPTQNWNIDSNSTKILRGKFHTPFKSKSPSRLNGHN